MTDPTSPPPQPAPAVSAPKPTSGPILGAIALGLAVLGFIMAILPPVAFIAWLPIVAAIILAIVALVKRSRPLALPLVAIILAPIAWIIAIVVATAGFFGGVSDAINNPPGQSSGDSEEAANDAGTRDNPYAIGTTASFDALIGADSWDLTVDGPAEDVTAAIAQANQFNPAPTFGAYYTVPVTVTYHGDDSDDPSFAFQYGLVSSTGQSYDSSIWVGQNPEGTNWVSLHDVGDLYDGASATVTLIFDAPAGFDGVLAVDRLFSGDGKAFFAVK